MKRTTQRKRQHGLALVEFTLVATLAFTVLFGILEIARAYWVVNTLEEAVRRGARLAAVCLVNDAAISELAVFNASGDTTASNILQNLDPTDIEVAYLDEDGVPVPDFTEPNYLRIRYVRVQIRNFQHQLLIPFITRTITFPDFVSVLPRESLGVTRTTTVDC